MPAKNGASRKCEHFHENGQQCGSYAIVGSDPPRCAPHRLDGGPAVGAPVGNKNSEKHGFYSAAEKPLLSIDDVVLDALTKQTQLSEYIEQQLGSGEVTPEEMANLFALHGQNATRIGRLMRDQKVLEGGGLDELFALIGEGLDLFDEEVGVRL